MGIPLKWHQGFSFWRIDVLLLVVAVVLIGIVVWEDRKEGYCGVSSRHVPIQGRGVCMKTSMDDPIFPLRQLVVKNLAILVNHHPNPPDLMPKEKLNCQHDV